MDSEQKIEADDSAQGVVFSVLQSIPFVEYWQHAASVLIIVLMSVWGRSRFVQITSFWMTVKGIFLLLFPGTVLDTMTVGKVDAIHLELMRGFGILLLVLGLYSIFFLSSPDSTVEMTLLLAHTVVYGLQGLNVLNAYMYGPKKKTPRLSDWGLESAMTGLPILSLISLYYLLSKPDWGGYAELPSQRNLHLRISFLFLFLLGVVHFAFPAAVIKSVSTTKSVDAVHAYLARSIGMLQISHSLVVARSTNFLREGDKSSVFVGQIVGLVLAMSSVLCSYVMVAAYHSVSSLVMVGFMGLLLTNCLYGADFQAFCKQCQIDLNSLKSFKLKLP
ncbi:hypothetical protein ScPMuIL_010974 [Solemya velum]